MTKVIFPKNVFIDGKTKYESVVGYFLTLEEINEVIGNAFDAGKLFEHEIITDLLGTAPDKEQYIKSKIL
jgi:hypothetical protein